SDTAGKALGKAISAGVGMAANAVVIGAKAKKGKYEEILADIGDMVAASFTIYAQDLVIKDPSAKSDARAKALTPTELGTVIANEFKVAAKVLSALKDPNPQTLLDALLEGLRSAAQVSSNYLASHVKEPDLKDEATARDARAKGKDPDKMTPEEYEA